MGSSMAYDIPLIMSRPHIRLSIRIFKINLARICKFTYDSNQIRSTRFLWI